MLGIDIGGTKLLAAVSCSAHSYTIVGRRETGRSFTPQAMVQAICDLVVEIEADGRQVEAIGVGFPGLVDHRTGLVTAHQSLMVGSR